MSAKAFVLIETSIGKTDDVVKAIRKCEGFTSVDAVTGPYDVIAVLECPDLPTVGDLLTKHIHKIDGVTRTVTCLCIKVG